jgi:hypothetical protein
MYRQLGLHVHARDSSTTTYVRIVVYIVTYYAREVLPYGQTTYCIK